MTATDRPTRPRGGFTLIELMMVVAIISVLIGLLLPALTQAREGARRVQCLSRMRQVGLGLIQEADRRGRFTASGNFSATGPEQYHSWVVSILGDLDQSDIAAAYDFNQPHNDLAASSNGGLQRTFLSVLTCPSDGSLVPGQGNLSYVVNGGFGWTQPHDCPITPRWRDVPSAPRFTPLDLNGDGKACGPADDQNAAAPDRRLYFQTGLFFAENWPYGSGGTSRHHSTTSVSDGSSSTILLAENVRAGYDPSWRNGWADPWPPRNSFFVSGSVCRDAKCSDGQVDYGKANDRSAGPWAAEAINASLDQAEGEAPWPSSFHPGGVNVIFCDGHAAFLKDTISGPAYAALVSPQGMRIGHPPLRQVIPGDDW